MRAALVLTVLVFAPALASAQVPCTGDARTAVDAVYRQLLERSANGEGANLVAELNNGQATVREVIRAVAKSTEHRQRFLTGNNQNSRVSAVTMLYRHILGRTPDPSGLNSHVQALASNEIAAVIDSLINSDEYNTNFGDDTVPGAGLRYCRGAIDSNQNGPVSRNRYENLDRNGNGSIERAEWNGNRTSFDEQDWNRDGVLSGDEIRTGGRRRGRNNEPTFDPNTPATWTDQSFRQIDRNSDGRIASSEWFFNTAQFRRADRNRDGNLTAAEFTSTSSTSSTNSDANQANRFDDLDANRNGRVDRNEWRDSADAFKWLDRNNDNVLSRAEVVGANGVEFDSYAGLDANRNGSVTYEEWRWTRRSFDRFDTDGNGVITQREFSAGGGAPAAATAR